VIVETGEKTFDTAALIDQCTPTSSIDASLAAAFRLPTTSVGDKSICTATIRSNVDEAIKLEVVLKIEPNVRIRTQERSKEVHGATARGREVPSASHHFFNPGRGRIPENDTALSTRDCSGPLSGESGLRPAIQLHRPPALSLSRSVPSSLP